MNFEELKKKIGDNPTIDHVRKLLGSDSFNEADELGKKYATKKSFVDMKTAPFCIDMVDAASLKVVIDDSVKDIIEKMKSIAIEQSDTSDKIGEHYEAVFFLVGRKKENNIFIDRGEWDEVGFAPNIHTYYDPDDYDRPFFVAPKKDVTTVSTEFVQKMNRIAEKSNDDSLVIIYGHTHHQTNELGQVNNYPSQTDIIASVIESLNYYQQENGTCQFLNAIINADGDLNIYGFNPKSKAFAIYDKVQYKSGKKINAYRKGLYPLSQPSSANKKD